MIAIIDYGIGNVGSLLNAFKKLNVPAVVTSDAERIRQSQLVVLPGVGAAGEGMKNLNKRKLDGVIKDEIKRGKPFLGICLGMQLLFEKSEEGNVNCLGILKGKVVRFRKERKIPQIGWNVVTKVAFSHTGRTSKRLYQNVLDRSYFYFVNSYYCMSSDISIIAGESNYGETFPSIIVKDNIIATQFHPEKSGAAGFQLLKNIIKLC